MKPAKEEGVGQRRRLEIAGENYYLIGTRDTAGKATFSVTVPDENKATGRKRRETAELICEAINEMLEMI